MGEGHVENAGDAPKLPFTTRITVVRLGNGDIVLHSPGALNHQ